MACYEVHYSPPTFLLTLAIDDFKFRCPTRHCPHYVASNSPSGDGSELVLELSELCSLELVSRSLLEESYESRVFFPADFGAFRFAFFRAFFSRRFCFSLSARASSFRYCLPDLSILMMISQTPRAHGGISSSQSF